MTNDKSKPMLYSCPSSMEADPVHDGATCLSITYCYEVKSYLESDVAAAVERIEVAMLFRDAQLS